MDSVLPPPPQLDGVPELSDALDAVSIASSSTYVTDDEDKYFQAETPSARDAACALSCATKALLFTRRYATPVQRWQLCVLLNILREPPGRCGERFQRFTLEIQMNPSQFLHSRFPSIVDDAIRELDGTGLAEYVRNWDTQRWGEALLSEHAGDDQVKDILTAVARMARTSRALLGVTDAAGAKALKVFGKTAKELLADHPEITASARPVLENDPLELESRLRLELGLLQVNCASAVGWGGVAAFASQLLQVFTVPVPDAAEARAEEAAEYAQALAAMATRLLKLPRVGNGMDNQQARSLAERLRGILADQSGGQSGATHRRRAELPTFTQLLAGVHRLLRKLRACVRDCPDRDKARLKEEIQALGAWVKEARKIS
jgi:hypothetical protein